MNTRSAVRALAGIALVIGSVSAAACAPQKPRSADLGASQSIKDLMSKRGLLEAYVEAGLKTYVLGGKYDDCVIRVWRPFGASAREVRLLDVVVVPEQRHPTIGCGLPRSPSDGDAGR